ADDDSGVTDSHRCRTVTPPPSDSHPRGDSQSGLNNVFEQRLFNSSKDNSSPLTPQRWEEREKNLESAKSQNQEYDTEGNEADQNQKTSPESELFETIREIYNSTLPELPEAEKITASRAKVLRQRIRESPDRKEPVWWKKFFSSVREFPWPMGQNKDKWRADFDWLIGERGMQKILEGAFLPFQNGTAFNEAATEARELEKKYTDERGLVDAKAILREIDAAAHRRRLF
ncbi:MAG: hypothetical protein LBS53_09010, partial [Synergistaceae bacterium]|nr:hypothetical protein [Synergistaceae bacterium]